VPERDDPKTRDPSRSIGRNLEPFLLLELLREPSYGYDLIRRLDDYGFRRATAEPAVVYKMLRKLEDDHSIQSQWSTKESGPARRYYEITDDGREVLQHRLFYLRRYLDRVNRLIGEYQQMTGNDLSDPLTSAEPELSGVGVQGSAGEVS
jgi:PadR family transcriptional regulator, regulatory protein PadR